MTIPSGPKVLITDANSRRSLTVVRSLGQRGIRVVAGNDQAFGLAFSSKYCSGRMTYPHPRKHPAECAAVLLGHLRRGSYDLFIPMGDEIVGLVSRRFREFSSAAPLLLPDPRALETALDKGETIRFASARGFAHPRTFFVDSLGALRRLKHEIPYPAVIKPRRGSGAEGIVFVKKPEHLTGQYLRIHRKFPFPLIQESIPHESPKYGVQCLFNRRGELRAAVAQRFSRQYPSRGGPGSCFETVDRPDILEQGVRLLQALAW
jgi:predicted ATP-grasp superfamily ATP-dependent carboligase